MSRVLLLLLALGATGSGVAAERIHIPIGIPNAVDQLKTFVEGDGSYSPGFGSFGVSFAVWDRKTGRLSRPTDAQADLSRGLPAGGVLIPHFTWRAGDVEVGEEICQVEMDYGEQGRGQAVASRVSLRNLGAAREQLRLFAQLQSIGPAGGAIRELEVCAQPQGSILVNGQSGIVASPQPDAAGVTDQADPVVWVERGAIPEQKTATSKEGNCSGVMAFDVSLKAGSVAVVRFLSPVHPGHRVQGHRWDGVSPWAQYDLNSPGNNAGQLQPDPGLQRLGRRSIDPLFRQSQRDWAQRVGKVVLRLPDPRWAESFRTILAHCAMNLNEGAPDVAVVNYNVYNRDGMYMANIFQKAGCFDWSEMAIDYFLGHPFNGRVQPEADNPGQILFLMGEHWKFTRDRSWLRRVYPATQKIASMIAYYRTTPGPHFVWDAGLEFGDALPATQRKELKPGACDGFNPNYTEAYDIAGLRAAALLSKAMGDAAAERRWQDLAGSCFSQFQLKFESNLPKGYGSYSVLWPCRLYPLSEGPAWTQFKDFGEQKPTDWRYFPLARAHQGLLAGNRLAGAATLATHLDHPQMRDWYALDEGGPSGVGGWHHVKSSWPITPLPWDTNTLGAIAMPHGWSIAEFELLLRDSLVFEEETRCVLLAGVPEPWFQHPDGIECRDLPTHFGSLAFRYRYSGGNATIRISGLRLAESVVIRTPPGLFQHARDGRGRPMEVKSDGSVLILLNGGKAECWLFSKCAPRGNTARRDL